MLLRDDAPTLELLLKLRGFGVRIALDDFGTGYSSLSYLTKFPFDKIKIDRAFVSNVARNGADSAIIDAVSSLGRSLNLVTVAEGVEQESQRQLLKAAGIAEMQGYLFSRPLPGTEVQKLLTGADEQTDSRATA
ncbi:MAG: EAL domain-containing protein [Rhizobiales bacterium]|nr:EAL domain-containing protein [Hyphomicrobiales bacterium]